jgi:signal transduction histidine kinase
MERSKNQTPPIGHILESLGVINRSKLDEAITELVLQLRTALEESNQQLRKANQDLEGRVAQRTMELQQTLVKLSEINQLKSNFVANISHELRTPLTHLQGYLELMQSGDLGEVCEQQKSALQIMQRATDRLSKLIEDMIMFSISERDHIFLRIQPVNILDLVHTAVNRSECKALERKIRLICEIPEEFPPIEADEAKISWVIMHLIDNAIKFTNPGGTVTVSLTETNAKAKITISDTGIGIPVSKLEEIFEPFHQLDSGSTRKFGGTGLGLALVKRIIAAHHSKITVDSKINVGSKFSFELKIYPTISR